MPFSVLYYPNLSLPPAAWVNSAILFFDQIGVIAPESIDPRELFDDRTRYLVHEGRVQPIYLGQHYHWNADTDRRFVNILVERHERERFDRNATRSRVHIGKLAYSHIVDSLARAGLCDEPHASEWIHLPPTVALELMTYLALQLVASPSLHMDLITDKSKAWRVLTGRVTQEPWVERQLRAVTELLPVSPSANVHRLLEFRDQHWRQLRCFRDYVDQLMRRAGAGGADHDPRFERLLDDAKQAREDIVRRLEAVRLARTAYRIAVSAVPMLAATADHSPWSAAAGLLPFFQQIAEERQEWRHRREALDSPLAYAALAARTFPAGGHRY